MGTLGIIIGIISGLFVDKVVKPKSMKEKLIVCIVAPVVVYFIGLGIIGMIFNWAPYFMGAKSVGLLVGCVTYIVTSLHKLKVNKELPKEDGLIDKMFMDVKDVSAEEVIEGKESKKEITEKPITES